MLKFESESFPIVLDPNYPQSKIWFRKPSLSFFFDVQKLGIFGENESEDQQINDIFGLMKLADQYFVKFEEIEIGGKDANQHKFSELPLPILIDVVTKFTRASIRGEYDESVEPKEEVKKN